MKKAALILTALVIACLAAGGALADQAFKVVDISERTFQEAPAISVILSAPLDPKVRHDQHLRISDQKEILKGAWILSEDNRTLYYTAVQPETQYTVTVLASLESADGAKLDQRVSQGVTTRKIVPAVSFAGDGLLLPPSLVQGLPVATVNIPAVDVEFFRLNDDATARYVDWSRPSKSLSTYWMGEILEESKVVFSGRFDLDPEPNRRVVRNIALDSIKALKKPGVYLAVMRKPGQYSYNYDASFFIVTDIALQAKLYKDMIYVTASSLKDGSPLPGVKLSFLDWKDDKIRELAVGETNEDGMFWSAGDVRKKTEFVKAEFKDQISVLPMRLPALDLSEFQYGSRPQKNQEIFAYGPRDLYRPGEKVIVSCLLRDYDGRPVPGAPIHATLIAPDGRKAGTYTWAAEALSDDDVYYWQGEMNLSKNAVTGEWRCELRTIKDSKKPDQIYKFHVEEFLPERMKLELESKQETLDPKGLFQIDVTGMYLYGAPASGNRVESSVLVKAQRTFSGKYKEFLFGKEDDENYSDFQEYNDFTLDAEGKGLITVDSMWSALESPAQVRVYAELFETGGRPVTRSISRTMWPAKTLVGLRPMFERDSVDQGKALFEVVRMAKDGAISPTSGLMVDVTKEDRDYYWEYTDNRGWVYRHTEKNYHYLSQILDLQPDKPTPLALDLPYGRYLLSIKDPETGNTASYRFYVGGWWWSSEQDKTARPDMVNLALDKPAYLPGDIIKVTVTPPHAGQAIIMVEGDKVLWSKRLEVPKEGAVVEIPMSASWDSHDLYISATVLRPIDAKEKIAPNRAVGLVHLPLDRTQRTLNINIDAPDKTEPNQKAEIALTLDKAPKEPVFVTLAAVDVGILNITNFKTPDPVEHFFGQRLYGVDIRDLYAKVAEFTDGKMIRPKWGGDADASPGGKKPESKVKLVALFHGPVGFDHQGKATVVLDLPDFNGTLRLMAVAFSDKSYGSTDQEMIVAAPVVTQLAMPRFLAPGDQSQFTLDVHNLSGEAQKLSLKMTATKAVTLKDGARKVSLADQEKTTLVFPVTAKSEGASKIQLAVTGLKKPMNRDWQIGIRPGYPAVSRLSAGVLRPGETFTLKKELVNDLVAPTIECSFKISPYISLPVGDSMRGLIRYPYGCLEQTTSSSYPLLVASDDAVRRYGLKPISREERAKRLEKSMALLAGKQMTNGGFSLWDGGGSEEPWLTAHAANFLLEARDAGYPVPEDMLDKALKRLGEYLRYKPPVHSWGSRESHTQLRFSIRAYAAYVLAKTKRAPLGTLRTLFDNHAEDARSCLPLVQIGLALDAMGDKTRAAKAFTMAADYKKTYEHYWGDYGSSIRDDALSLAILPDEQFNSDKWTQKLLELNKTITNRKYYSTQEKYAILLLGLRLDSMSGKEWKGELSVGRDKDSIDGIGAFTFNPSPDECLKGVSYTHRDGAVAFISVSVQGYTKTPPPKDDSMIFVRRTLFDLHGKEITASDFKVGEVMLAELEMISETPLYDALVVDMLPAGFELENPAVSQGLKVQDIVIDDKSVYEWRRGGVVQHEQFLDDRYVAAINLYSHRAMRLHYLVRAVSPGTYTFPPVMVESMYQPEIRGVSETPKDITIENVGKTDKDADSPPSR
ncbi:alpha-2-macroglobulin family protein [Desulfatibacillum aliphaticivorans]|uniref:alpha-2-macroglobulin family protein n=1 Tax=Desulfatibacillum aliphaticivorans TaxID=218208 RepID=UPI000415B504|nr:alpha-2-macroglobulin [Desulfatibacillum aliphaticivorans]